MINIALHANIYKHPCLLLSLDAEKAFDRVAWPFLKDVLLKFGFSGPSLSSILTLYSNPTARICASSYYSPYFRLTNGTGQGCPLSPLIFALLMEPLAEKIRSNPLIKGYQIGQREYKLSLFADDVILSLVEPEVSLSAMFETLSSFSKVSYYKTNTNKTEALPIWIDNTCIPTLKKQYPFVWQQASIKYLGINLAMSVKDLYKLNFAPFITNLHNLI